MMYGMSNQFMRTLWGSNITAQKFEVEGHVYFPYFYCILDLNCPNFHLNCKFLHQSWLIWSNQSYMSTETGLLFGTFHLTTCLHCILHYHWKH